MAKPLRGPELHSISPDFNKIKFWCTNNVRQLTLVRNYIIGKPIRYIMKTYVKLFDSWLERYKGNIVCLFNRLFKSPTLM